MRKLVPLLLATLLIQGCASVTVQKYTDSQTKEGLPFYLPRPYVSIFEPFVVASKVFLVSGQVSPDGLYILIDNSTDNLSGYLHSDPSAEKIKIPIKQVRNNSKKQSLNRGFEQSEDVPSTSPAENSDAKNQGAKENKESASTSTNESTSSAGKIKATVTNDNSAFAITPGRKFFDIVWLPDFEEKYLVQVKPGLGSADVGMRLGQGWSLQGLNANVDNSKLIEPLLAAYTDIVAGLSKLTQSKLAPASLLSKGGEQAFETSSATPGARLTIKVTIVRIAAPGIYPILKKSEALEADSALGKLTDNHLNLMAPLYPFTNVAYNTYEIAVIEGARPYGDTPMNLQRYFTESTISPSTATKQSLVAPSATQSAGDIEKTLNTKLSQIKGTDGAYWVLSETRIVGSQLHTKAKLNGGKQPHIDLTDKDSLISFIVSESKNAFQRENIILAN